MAEEWVHRRLTATLAENIVGYSRLMEADKEGAIARQKELRASYRHVRIHSGGRRRIGFGNQNYQRRHPA
jgi:adenylate cyclase